MRSWLERRDSETLSETERVPRDARRLRLYTFQYFRKRAPPLRYCTSYYGVVHIIISVRCKKTNCALRRPTINSVWVCRLGLVTRLSAAPGRAEFFRTRRLLSPSTGGLWMRTSHEAMLAMRGTTRPLTRPAARCPYYAARRTLHAARRTPHRLLSNGRCGNARSHAGAQLAERARLQGSSRLSSFSCLSSSSRIFFIVRPCWRCFCSGAQTVSTQRTEAHRKLRVVCAPLAGCPTFRRA